MAEDYLLRGEVDTIAVEKVIKSAVCLDANYLLMSGCIEHDKWINEYFGELRKGREYRTSVYFSLFKKETFELLIKETESAWLFETEGAIRSMVF